MTAIVAEGISKKFRLSQSRGSIKDRLAGKSRGSHQEFWALQPIDVRVEQGETVGILGHNGSGKSTLLKCIAGILKPTTGVVQVRGRVASLLELGAGFHPDLTGRENVFINASFLGISRKEIERRFDDIVGFAQLENFIDQQVKYYSSGMFVRLGFAVAINVDPDVLLVDEVLAVGDEAFQQKCLDRVEEFQREGRTILFVTHGADQVRRICNRALVLDHGTMVADAAPGEAIRVFREHLHGTMSETATQPEVVDSPMHWHGVRVVYPDPQRHNILTGESLSVSIDFACEAPIDDAVLAVEVRNFRGETMFSANTDTLGTPLARIAGSGALRIDLQHVPLLDGTYPVSLQLRHRHDGKVLAMREGLDSFEVMSNSRVEGQVMLPTTISVETTPGGAGS
jgi:ABC-2 type transport system ATP-binding protein